MLLIYKNKTKKIPYFFNDKEPKVYQKSIADETVLDELLMFLRIVNPDSFVN